MCVIIYIPKGQTISEDEIRDAWLVNPDGAGFSIRKDNRVYFKRGYMNVESFINDIKPLIGNFDLVLHFRISTSSMVNKVQTHPYKKGNVTITEGSTTRPVICMNGIISGQKEYKGCNDTMSYIIDHNDAFANINQDILDIIEDSTGAKWCVMTPEGVLTSSKFIEDEGRYYSNQNHIYRTVYYKRFNAKKKETISSLIKSKSLRRSIKKDKELYEDLQDFIGVWCNSSCDLCQVCSKCLKSARTLRDVKIILNENYYYGDDDYYETEEICSDCYQYNDEYEKQLKLYNDLYDYESGYLLYSEDKDVRYLFDE